MKKINKEIRYNFFRSILLVKTNNTGPEIAKISAKTVISCPAELNEIFISVAIIGSIPPTINSTKPTATVDNASIKTLKFIFCYTSSLMKKLENKKILITKNE